MTKTTKKLQWRLGKLPTPEEVQMLVSNKIITQEEAREILFSEITEEEATQDELRAQIKFLKELVENLSNNQRTQVVEKIKYLERPYYNYEWFKPYIMWCNSGGTLTATSGTGGNMSFTKIIS